MGKPINDDGGHCPLIKDKWGGPAKVEHVCHKCTWYQHVRGRNPNTGADVDKWECAIAMMPMLLIENASMTNQLGAATESFRNELVKMHVDGVNAVQAVASRVEDAKKLARVSEIKLIDGQAEPTDSD